MCKTQCEIINRNGEITMMIHMNMTAVFALVWLLWYLYTLQKRWVPKIKEAIYTIWRDNGVETNDDSEEEEGEEEAKRREQVAQIDSFSFFSTRTICILFVLVFVFFECIDIVGMMCAQEAVASVRKEAFALHIIMGIYVCYLIFQGQFILRYIQRFYNHDVAFSVMYRYAQIFKPQNYLTDIKDICMALVALRLLAAAVSG